jgi:sodium/potassium-transporting ATPase subunit beta
MIYDPSTGAILTRTPSNWAKILLFFFVFYSVLALFAAGMLNIYFYGFVDEDTPVLHGNYSVMPQNPGMGFRPIPDWDRSIIHYRKSDKESYQKYVQALQDFLQPNNSDKAFDYRHGQDEFVDCTQNSTESEGKVIFRSCSKLYSLQ